jgi:phage shock protein PspC (stress-responsive transcriptional regulator)/heme/copper-type cytochrome/quinol oxidase subunit 2
LIASQLTKQKIKAMKQVININFQGRVVPIEVTAFDMLKNYTESLNKHFANEEGKEEIINDIESRIGELFQARLKDGATCITDDDVSAIINSMGRPEDLETADGTQSSGSGTQDQQSGNSQQQYTYNAAASKRLYRDVDNKVLGGVCSGLGNYFNIDPVIVRIIFIVTFGVAFLPYLILWAAVPSSSASVIGGARKKLYRDGDDKIIAGVCSGIGNYFGINPWIPRALFLLPFLTFVFRWGHWGYWDFPNFLRVGFSPGALIIYIILWLVVPEAVTTAEKLEMKGEKVDIDSIKNSVMEEMKGFQQRAEKFGKEAAGYTKEKSKAMSAEINTAAKRSSRSFGDILVFLLKLFAYFIAAIVGIVLIVTLFTMGIVAVGLFPLKDFIISDGWQNVYAIGTLVFFIGVPIIGIITWIIRRITKSKGNSKVMRLTFGSLWVLGWISVVFLVASISRDFSYNSKNLAEQEIVLSNPNVNKLEITTGSPLEKYTRYRWLRLEPFASMDEDTAYVKNFDVRIVKSPNDSFRVTMIKMASGWSRTIADFNASIIHFNGIQKDSVLQLDRGIAINKTDKFRNQHVILTIYVPVGKHIKIDRNIGWFNDVHVGRSWNDVDWNDDYNDEVREWKTNVEYEMRADGHLYTLNGIPAGKEENYKTRVIIDGNGIEVNTNSDNDNNYRYNDNQPLNKVDSLKIKLDKEKQSLKDSLKKASEKIHQQLEKLDNTEEPGPGSTYVMPMYGPVMNIN